ncbi:MAG: hypothetical protein K0R47_3470 [Brevibacillus sp.]|jgi:hypothetical protein|nr:hypothetical protein [Brevibacillus sp.]
MQLVIRHLRNERGNMTIFVMTIFFFMLLIIFTLLFNFSTVFVDKEVAANSAQQVSLTATQIIYKEMEEAIHKYDLSIKSLVDPVFIWELVETAESSIRAANPDWSHSEVRYQAIDNVLLYTMPIYPDLKMRVLFGLEQAFHEIPGVATDILDRNQATQAGSYVKLFNSDRRIEVRTSVRYESKTFGLDFMPEHVEQVYQTGESRRIGFVADLGWPDRSISL